MPEIRRGFAIRELWEKYEEIAMHFNDLIIRLRTQALAGVAALSTLVGVFAKADLGPFSYSWEIAGFVFLGLILFWIAIWILDFTYYNKLLIGAVVALVELETKSRTSNIALEINLSTRVEQSVRSELVFPGGGLTGRQKFHVLKGRWAFYVIVLVALIAGASFSFYTYWHPRAASLAVVPLTIPAGSQNVFGLWLGPDL
jgi:hypothetical protein